VELLGDETPRPGMRWRDVTWPGTRPELELLSMRRPDEWVERGRWRGFEGVLTLTFEPTSRGCLVSASFRIEAPGPIRPLGPVLTAAGVLSVTLDLKRAAQILET